MFQLTLFVKADSSLCDIIRYMLLEKGVEYREINVDEANGTKVCVEIFGQQVAPAIADHETKQTDLDLIMEYVEERYPHPAMMPSSPSERATTRLFLRRLLRDYYPLLEQFELHGCTDSRDRLQAEIRSLAPAFASKPYFISDEFSILDCVLGPLLYRLRSLPMGPEIGKYLARTQGRDSFKKVIGKEPI